MIINRLCKFAVGGAKMPTTARELERLYAKLGSAVAKAHVILMTKGMQSADFHKLDREVMSIIRRIREIRYGSSRLGSSSSEQQH
jgi:hypothetical protein